MISSEYIALFLADHGVKHCYGYQGTMIAFLADAICRNDNLVNHVCYNEQGAAFAAVGEAKVTGNLSVAYATSGPGAANMISGIADAYFDSAPVMFFTGQLNTYEYQDVPGLRQHGFQEMNIVDMVRPVTKYAVQVQNTKDLPSILEKAFHEAVSGRPGPVLIDLPMNIQRESMEDQVSDKRAYCHKPLCGCDFSEVVETVKSSLEESERPLLLLGNGVAKLYRTELRKVIEWLGIPVVTSLHGRDILPEDHPLNFGYIGYAYGHRYANILINKKADLIISAGCNLNRRQTGMKTELFAKDAKIIRIDIDPVELKRTIHQNEVIIREDAVSLLRSLWDRIEGGEYENRLCSKYKEWVGVCSSIKSLLAEYDRKDPRRFPNHLIEMISDKTKGARTVVCDVGQHQMWGAQSYHLHADQRMIFSGGHGAMGFSVPAAIGAHYACNKPVVTLTGDGSMQMNIQELQWIFRENLPITIFVFNNRALGLIHQQQDALFDSRYFASVKEGGYLAPDFRRVAQGYGINSMKVECEDELRKVLDEIDPDKPNLVEIVLPEDSVAVPKTAFGEEMHNQSPLIPAEMLQEILSL